MVDAGTYRLAVKQKLNAAELMLNKLGGDGIKLVRFTSDNKKAVSVSKKGKVSAKKAADNVTITGYRREGKKYIPVAKLEISVVKPVFAFKDMDEVKFDLTYPGQSIDLNSYISGVPHGAAINWTIPKKCKAAVLEGGRLRAVKNGTVKVSCLIGDAGYAAKYSAVIKIKIPKLSESIKLKQGKTRSVSIKNVSGYTDVRWEGAPGLVITDTKDIRKVKISAASAGEYELKAFVDGQVYICHVNVR